MRLSPVVDKFSVGSVGIVGRVVVVVAEVDVEVVVVEVVVDVVVVVVVDAPCFVRMALSGTRQPFPLASLNASVPETHEICVKSELNRPPPKSA